MAYFIMNMDFNLDKKTKRLYIIKLVSDHSITVVTRPCQGLDSSSISMVAPLKICLNHNWELIMMKKLILLILFISFSAFTHSVKDGDMDGSWQIVEAFINGEKVENANGRMVASEGFASVNWMGSDGTKHFLTIRPMEVK